MKRGITGFLAVVVLSAPTLAFASFNESVAVGQAQVNSLGSSQLDALNPRVFSDAFLTAKIIGYDPATGNPSASEVLRRWMDARVKPAHDERIAFVTVPALQRTAPQELRAALRPGHGSYLIRATVVSLQLPSAGALNSCLQRSIMADDAVS
jgi:hypothetical protein